MAYLNSNKNTTSFRHSQDVVKSNRHRLDPLMKPDRDHNMRNTQNNLQKSRDLAYDDDSAPEMKIEKAHVTSDGKFSKATESRNTHPLKTDSKNKGTLS